MHRSLCSVLVLVALSEPIFAGNGPVDGQFFLDACKKANGMTDELITSLFSSKLNPEMDNPQAQCFLACWMEGIGILKSDGTVNAAHLVNNLEKILGKQVENVDEETQVLIKCGDQPGEGCEKKYKIAVCVQRAQDLVKFRKSN